MQGKKVIEKQLLQLGLMFSSQPCGLCVCVCVDCVSVCLCVFDLCIVAECLYRSSWYFFTLRVTTERSCFVLDGALGLPMEETLP